MSIRYEPIEYLLGRGKVFSGEQFFAEADYSLAVLQVIRDVGTNTKAKEVRERREVRGNITGGAWHELLRDDIHKDTLELENGRRVDFVFEDVLSGRIVGSES